MKNVLLALLLLTPMSFSFSDDEDERISAEYYLKLKSAGKVTLSRDAQNQVIMSYFAYDPDTGSLIRQPQRVIYSRYLNAEKASLQSRINNINILLQDIANIP